MAPGAATAELHEFTRVRRDGTRPGDVVVGDDRGEVSGIVALALPVTRVQDTAAGRTVGLPSAGDNVLADVESAVRDLGLGTGRLCGGRLHGQGFDDRLG